MQQKLTIAEFRERRLELDRIQREEFRVHWRQIAFDAFLSFVGHASIGYAAGLSMAIYGINQAFSALPVH